MDTLNEWLRRIVNLWHKELLSILKDPSSRVILIAPALVQSFLFGYAATFDLNNVPYALLDQSHSDASTELIARLDGTGVFHRVATLRTQKDISDIVDAGKAILVIQIGSDFADKLAAGQSASVQVILDGRNSTTASTALGLFSSIVGSYNLSLQNLEQPPLTVEARAWYNPNLETRWNIVPALIAALSMLQTLLLTALSVAREREQGTFDQLLVTPLSPMEIMIGKAVPPVLIGLLQSSIILTVSLFWFDIPMAGSLITLYAGLSLFTIACVGIGLSISAVSVNMQQAMLYTFVLIMPMMLLSGLATPIENMPDFLQGITYLNPLRYAVDLVRRVYFEGAVLIDLLHDLYPLVIIAAVTLPLAAWLFRNRLV